MSVSVYIHVYMLVQNVYVCTFVCMRMYISMCVYQISAKCGSINGCALVCKFMCFRLCVRR